MSLSGGSPFYLAGGFPSGLAAIDILTFLGCVLGC